MLRIGHGWMPLKMRHLACSVLLMGCATTDRSPGPIHMLVLKCEGGGEKIYQSRIAVLDRGDPETDYGIGAAHAVHGQQSCVVQDDRGGSRRVDAFRMAPDYDPARPVAVFRDWSVMTFERFPSDRLVRFSLRPAPPGDMALIPRGRGLLTNAKPCTITYRDTRVPPIGEITVYPTHGCRTQGGQSGTPMTVLNSDGEHSLFGLVTGRTYLYPEQEGEVPRWYGRFLPLDGALVAKMDAALTELAAERP